MLVISQAPKMQWNITFRLGSHSSSSACCICMGSTAHLFDLAAVPTFFWNAQKSTMLFCIREAEAQLSVCGGAIKS